MMRPKDLRQGSGTKTFLEAMHSGKVHLARFILDALDGRIINSKTENSRTPLMHAVCLQDAAARSKFTRLLLEKGANVNCQDEDGRTALSHACEMGHLDVVKLLVQFNADPDVADAWGNSALMYAAFSGHGQVLEFLVRAFKRLGVRLDRTNNAGHSATDIASFFGHNHCVQILNFTSRKGTGKDDPFSDVTTLDEGEYRLPNRFPRHVLDRFSKQQSNKEQLPDVFQRQTKTGDSSGSWNRFKCPRSSSQDDNHQHSWALPPQIEKSEIEEDHSILFAAKQLQNCQLREAKGSTVMNSFPEKSQREVSGASREQTESFPLWGKAKSFNLDLLSSRKQSYQGDARDMALSASKLKRASLQDDRCLINKMECQGSSRGLTKDTSKIHSVPKPLLKSKAQSGKALQENSRSQDKEVNDTAPPNRREKRGSLGSAARHNKLLLARGETETEKVPRHGPGFMGLGTRLLRRFTAPEFMRMVIDCSSGPSHGRGRMSRSETFPLSNAHQQVNSQPSVDSISAVRCEFESFSSQSTLD